MEFSVIVPLFNEEDSLKILNASLCKVMEDINYDYEIIYVDDGSTDSSLEVLKRLKKDSSKIKIISFNKNRGQSAALFAGFNASQGRWIITLDADLQNPPEDIFKLLKFRNDFDFITGIRIKRKDSFIRRVSSSVAKFFRWLVLKDDTKDTGCSLRMFKREIIEIFPFFKNFHRFFTFLVKKLRFRVKEIEVKHKPRKFGKSKYGTLKRTKEGLLDLWGVFWLKKNLLNYEVKYRD